MSRRAMRVLLLHNHYQQPGGEDQVFSAEADLLEAFGHQVLRYTVRNDELNRMSSPNRVRATLWNATTYREIRRLIRQARPQIAHFHNTFPLISPSAYWAARAEGVPVVQTLHNFRLLCPNALFFREGRVCEDCSGKTIPWPGTLHACYRGDRIASAAVATMLSAHRALGTWTNAVDTYIALTEFARKKFVEGGLPADKIVVKPNFYPEDPGAGDGQGNFFLFVGRLAKEKGVDTMLEAWARLGGEAPLKVVGDGPLSARLREAAKHLGGVEWLGRQPKEAVLKLMREASGLIFPSLWYEGFPMVLVEAFASGLPVVASSLGSMSSLVDDGRNGLLFTAGDASDLAVRVRWMSTHPSDCSRMRLEARKDFDTKYSSEQNYTLLSEIYKTAANLW